MPRPASHPIGACLSHHDSSTKRPSALFGPPMRHPRFCDFATCQPSTTIPSPSSPHQSHPPFLFILYITTVSRRNDISQQRLVRLPSLILEVTPSYQAAPPGRRLKISALEPYLTSIVICVIVRSPGPFISIRFP